MAERAVPQVPREAAAVEEVRLREVEHVREDRLEGRGALPLPGVHPVHVHLEVGAALLHAVVGRADVHGAVRVQPARRGRRDPLVEVGQVVGVAGEAPVRIVAGAAVELDPVVAAQALLGRDHLAPGDRRGRPGRRRPDPARRVHEHPGVLDALVHHLAGVRPAERVARLVVVGDGRRPLRLDPDEERAGRARRDRRGEGVDVLVRRPGRGEVHRIRVPGRAGVEQEAAGHREVGVGGPLDLDDDAIGAERAGDEARARPVRLEERHRRLRRGRDRADPVPELEPHLRLLPGDEVVHVEDLKIRLVVARRLRRGNVDVVEGRVELRRARHVAAEARRVVELRAARVREADAVRRGRRRLEPDLRVAAGAGAPGDPVLHEVGLRRVAVTDAAVAQVPREQPAHRLELRARAQEGRVRRDEAHRPREDHLAPVLPDHAELPARERVAHRRPRLLLHEGPGEAGRGRDGGRGDPVPRRLVEGRQVPPAVDPVDEPPELERVRVRPRGGPGRHQRRGIDRERIHRLPGVAGEAEPDARPALVAEDGVAVAGLAVLVEDGVARLDRTAVGPEVEGGGGAERRRSPRRRAIRRRGSSRPG